mmetsp:Transcript_126495/g.252753  ORF Transcript_126495/g.252753 Transcript_126495/m.252753 type:complete len:103 (+) Transcript_126495:154-462(+)
MHTTYYIPGPSRIAVSSSTGILPPAVEGAPVHVTRASAVRGALQKPPGRGAAREQPAPMRGNGDEDGALDHEERKEELVDTPKEEVKVAAFSHHLHQHPRDA